MHLSCLNRHLSVTANSINCVLYIFEFDSVEFGEPLPGEEGGDDATEAGGGNLHRGRGATAWGREEGGDDATKAGGGSNLHRGWGATAWNLIWETNL